METQIAVVSLWAEDVPTVLRESRYVAFDVRDVGRLERKVSGTFGQLGLDAFRLFDQEKVVSLRVLDDSKGSP